MEPFCALNSPFLPKMLFLLFPSVSHFPTGLSQIINVKPDYRQGWAIPEQLFPLISALFVRFCWFLLLLSSLFYRGFSPFRQFLNIPDIPQHSHLSDTILTVIP